MKIEDTSLVEGQRLLDKLLREKHLSEVELKRLLVLIVARVSALNN